MKALTETHTCMSLCFVWSAVSNPQIKLTNSPSSYRLCCLTVWITQFSEVSLKFTVWSQQRRPFSCQTIVSNRCRKDFSVWLILSSSVCLCVSLSLAQLQSFLEHITRASRCSSSSSITATCTRPACHLSDLSPPRRTQPPWYAPAQREFHAFFRIPFPFSHWLVVYWYI